MKIEQLNVRTLYDLRTYSINYIAWAIPTVQKLLSALLVILSRVAVDRILEKHFEAFWVHMRTWSPQCHKSRSTMLLVDGIQLHAHTPVFSHTSADLLAKDDGWASDVGLSLGHS